MQSIGAMLGLSVTPRPDSETPAMAEKNHDDAFARFLEGDGNPPQRETSRGLDKKTKPDTTGENDATPSRQDGDAAAAPAFPATPGPAERSSAFVNHRVQTAPFDIQTRPAVAQVAQAHVEGDRLTASDPGFLQGAPATSITSRAGTTSDSRAVLTGDGAKSADPAGQGAPHAAGGKAPGVPSIDGKAGLENRASEAADAERLIGSKAVSTPLQARSMPDAPAGRKPQAPIPAMMAEKAELAVEKPQMRKEAPDQPTSPPTSRPQMPQDGAETAPAARNATADGNKRATPDAPAKQPAWMHSVNEGTERPQPSAIDTAQVRAANRQPQGKPIVPQNRQANAEPAPTLLTTSRGAVAAPPPVSAVASAPGQAAGPIGADTVAVPAAVPTPLQSAKAPTGPTSAAEQTASQQGDSRTGISAATPQLRSSVSQPQDQPMATDLRGNQTPTPRTASHAAPVDTAAASAAGLGHANTAIQAPLVAHGKIMKPASLIKGASSPTPEAVGEALIGSATGTTGATSALRVEVAQGALPVPDDVRQLLRQVVDGIVARGERDHVTLRLDPPELGQLDLDLAMENGRITATITAERPETLDLVRRHVDLLQRELADAGFDGADVAFSDQGAEQRDQPHAKDAEARDAPRSAPQQPQASKAPSTPAGRLDMRL